MNIQESIAWLDSGGCENGWHEIVRTEDGKIQVIHVDEEVCTLSECGVEKQ